MNKVQIKDIPEFLLQGTVNRIIDIRPSLNFIQGFIPASLSIPLHKLGESLPYISDETSPLLFVGEGDLTKEEKEHIHTLGLKNKLSFLEGGYSAWQSSGGSSDIIIDIEADEFVMDSKFDSNMLLVDVRSEEDYNKAHIAGAYNFPASFLKDMVEVANIDIDKNLYIHCGGGSRSVLVASFLKRQDIHNVYIISCGFKCLEETGLLDIARTKNASPGNEI